MKPTQTTFQDVDKAWEISGDLATDKRKREDQIWKRFAELDAELKDLLKRIKKLEKKENLTEDDGK